MAVDISTDLNITLLARDIKPPTITGLYDAGSPPGTYLPGRDFSPTDDVSTGAVAELQFSVAFDSISNQLYNLDRVYIQSVDDPLPVIRITESINAFLPTERVFQTLQATNYSCIRPLGSAFVRMVDSETVSFGPSVTPRVQYTTNAGTPGGGDLPVGSYQALFGRYDFPAAYDPNQVGELVANGGIPLMSYAALIALGQVPNILAVTLTQDPLAGQDVNYALPVLFNFDGDLDVLTQAEFAALYAQAPRNSYPSYFYSYMSLGVCYATMAEANGSVGSLLSGVDSFVLRNGRVFLELGTTAKDQSANVQRFNGTSIVRSDRPISTIDAFIQYIVTEVDNGFAPPVITNYTKGYCLNVRWTTQPGVGSAFIHIPAGTVLTLNNAAALYSDSNTVEVRLVTPPMPPERCQAITNVIASVAMEQRALTHILNAEGKKLQKALSMPLTLEQTLAFNRSATSLVEAVSTLEHILKRRLDTVDCNLCTSCASEPATEDE